MHLKLGFKRHLIKFNGFNIGRKLLCFSKTKIGEGTLNLLSNTRKDIEDPLFTIEKAIVKNIHYKTPYKRTSSFNFT